MNEEENKDSDESQENESKERKLVVPGEVILTGADHLPGDGTRKVGDDIVANCFGLAEELGKVVRVIPVSGAYVPRRHNTVIGRVTDITFRGWVVDIDAAESAFLPLDECPKFINRSEMDQHLAIGDVISAKILGVNSRGTDLTTKGRGLGELRGGFVFRVVPSRVPRIIGREGSMINLIKDKTGCHITVGQNGWVWIKGEDLDKEILARKAVEFVADKVNVSGLTEWLNNGLRRNLSKMVERKSGRKKDEMRKMEAKVGVIPNADGSAIFSFGDTVAIASVYGPRKLHPQHMQDPAKAVLRCSYDLLSFSVGERKRPGPSRRSKEISKVTEWALSPVVDLSQFPGTVIDVQIYILQADAGTRTAGINAASMALAHAGVPMKDLICSVALGKLDKDVVVDVDKQEEDFEDGEGATDLPIAKLANSDEFTLLQMDGKIQPEKFVEAIELSDKVCKEIFETQKEALKASFEEETK